MVGMIILERIILRIWGRHMLNELTTKQVRNKIWNTEGTYLRKKSTNFLFLLQERKSTK